MNKIIDTSCIEHMVHGYFKYSISLQPTKDQKHNS